MIVILIIVIMTAITIPVMSSASDVRRAREGARVLSTMLASAQTEAQVSGRPAAVWIQRLTSSSGQATNAAAAMDIYMAEVPPPYLGDTLTSTATITISSTSQPATVTFNSANLTTAGVQNGDIVRFEYRGEFYRLAGVSGTSATITPLDTSLLGTAQAYPYTATTGSPFQIYRRPIKTLASAVQLSDGVAVDLTNSGADPGASSFAESFAAASGSDNGAIIVTFNSAGQLDMVYNTTATSGWPVRPNSGVYFLVGKIDNITTGTPTPPQIPNYQDLNSRWVAVNRNGLTTTAEAASGSGGAPPTSVIDSLRLARSAQSAGGQ